MTQKDNEKAKYYRRKKNTSVTAVQINLETDGFTYEKWGGEQRCRAGDWLINNGDSCHTVSDSTFKRTYRQESPGRYAKHTRIRARKAIVSGKVSTQEGETAYAAGDYLIDNNEAGTDTYAMSEQKFHKLYELADNQNGES